MKIKKEEILNALEKVKPGLSTKDLIEFTNCFYFSSKHIITFNDEIYVSYPFSTDFNGTIASNKFMPFISKIKPNIKGLISIENNEKEIIVKSGKSKSGFSIDPKGKLPLDEIKESFGDIKWKTIPDNFLEGIRLAAFCCSRNIETPLLSCINIKKDEIQSTDRFRCFTFELSSKMKPFLLSFNVVSILTKLNIIKYSIGDSWIHFITDDNLQISTRIYSSDDYPDIEQYFDGKGKQFIFPENIKEILEKAIIFCDEVEKEIKVTISDKILEIRSEGNTDWFIESIKCKPFPQTISFKINPFFLQDILSKTNECEIIVKKGTLKFITENWKHIVSIVME